MANIVIKRRLDLSFLGDEYHESYLTFKAIPVIEHNEIQRKIAAVKDDDNDGAVKVMVDILQEYFYDGIFLGEKVIASDIGSFDEITILRCYQTLTNRFPAEEGGVTIDPKDESSSTSQSTTEQNRQTSS